MKPIIVEKIEKHTFTPEDINDLIVTALEGGITYWCRQAIMMKNENNKYLGVDPSDQDKVQFASDLIGYGGTLILIDSETDEEYELTLDKMLEGIKVHCTAKGIALSDLIDQHDAEDVDCIVQYALFNEITFG